MFRFADKKILQGILIALSVAVLVNAGFFLGLFDGLELKSFDLRAKFNSKKPSKDVAIILIDEASLRGMNPIVGRWPWPRSVHADVVDFLAMSGAKAVMFDILFTENERGSGIRKGRLDPSDQALVDSTAAAGNVYHAAQIVLDEEDEYNKSLMDRPMPKDFVDRFSTKVENVPPSKHNNFYLPFKQLYQASKGIGIVEFLSDPDGVLRRTKLFRNYHGDLFPVLPMAPFVGILQPDSISYEGNKIYMKGLKFDSPEESLSQDNPRKRDLEIPLQSDGSYLINMYKGFKPYSMSGVLASIQKIKSGDLEGLPVNPEEFMGKVVFIGGSAVGIEDLKATSMGTNTPGVYLHASAYSNLVNEDFLKYTGRLATSIIILIFAGIVTTSILWSRNIIYYQLGLPLFLTFAFIAFSFWWFRHNMVLDVVAPTFSIAISWMGSFAFLSFTEGKDKRKIKKMLSQYVSPSILTTLIDKSPQDILKAEIGSKENLTILFSDIRGFTTLSEAMDAEKVVEMLNGYLSGMVDVIFKYEGTLDKFIGDAIMAFWGAPIRIPDHARKAVLAAFDMRKQLEVYNRELESKGGKRIDIGIGINTGNVILGNIGSEKKLDYTIIGDNVNLASRMEGLTKEYGAPILVTEPTYEDIKSEIPCRVIDIVRAAGKKKGIKIFEPLNMKSDDVTDKIIRLSDSGFNSYLARDWTAAILSYTELLAIKPGDKTSKLLIERCEVYKTSEPDADWDGVHIMSKK